MQPVDVDFCRQRFLLRVLVVDDSPPNQKIATLMLEKMGHRVDVAANGEEAVETLRTLPYDLVFMDVQMPVMDGYEATGVIRSLPDPVGKVTIIAMTANAMKGDEEKCRHPVCFRVGSSIQHRDRQRRGVRPRTRAAPQPNVSGSTGSAVWHLPAAWSCAAEAGPDPAARKPRLP